MQAEIEAKFTQVSHDVIRQKLKSLGAKCESSMTLMRRAMFDYPDGRFQKNGHTARLRVRDEGQQVKINFKSKNNTNYVDEIETTVGSYDTMCELLQLIGLVNYSIQESRREIWHLNNVEIVLDEWPWLDPYIEIEAEKEEDIMSTSVLLGLDWSTAKFGSVDSVYRVQYPGLKENESIGEIKNVSFDSPLPAYLIERRDP